MFSTFRIRLLFWFLVFISSSLVIVILAMAYTNEREEIFVDSEALEEAYISLLKSVQSQKSYFAYETINENYFKTGRSEWLNEYNRWYDSTRFILTQVDYSNEPELQKRLQVQKNHLRVVDSLFLDLTLKIRIHGYKDFGMEGAMRLEAHWLENCGDIPNEQILSLRRFEKDYIMRNEIQYVTTLKSIVEAVRKDVSMNPRLTRSRKDSLILHLNEYESKFLDMVEMDHKIGLKDNSGMKKVLDDRIHELTRGFDALVQQTHQWAHREFNELTISFGITVLILVLGSLFISTFISRRITKPLTELTGHITHFVESDFTLESNTPVVQSKDEIGKLTKNFSILKEEVISQMKFFKQRVEERTKDLAKANERMARISEANSRFVPTEFLNNLGKESIEEVKLGDQVERNMTVLFTDIRGFTKISEDLNSQETFDFLNQYLGGIVPIILKEGGFIDKFIGDSVMALFPGDPDQAIKASLQFEGFLEHFNKRNELVKHLPQVEMGTGIHTGSMVLGTIGHADRLETTVISDAVNTAARVEGLTKFYGAQVIATSDTIDGLKDKKQCAYRFLDKVQVKGKSNALSVYEIIRPVENEKVEYLEEYNKAIDLFTAEKMKEAAGLFEELSKINPKDTAVKRFFEKSKSFNDGSNQSWGDVTKMTIK